MRSCKKREVDNHLLSLQESWMAANFDQKALKEYIKDTDNLLTQGPPEEKEVDVRKEFSKLAAIMAIGRTIK